MACRGGVCSKRRSGGSPMPSGSMGPSGGVSPEVISLPKQKRSWTGSKQGDVVGINQYTPQQNEIMNWLLQFGRGNLENPGQGFDPIKQDTLNTFNQEIVPDLLERFSASGSNSASSPVIQSNLASAGSNLAQKLAAFQAQYNQSNQQNALAQLQLGLNPRSEFINRQGGGGWVNSAKDMFGALAGGFGRAAGSWLFPV